MIPINIFAEDNEGELTDTIVKSLVNMLTITHLQQLPSGHLAIHVMSGRVLVCDISFDEFVEKMSNRSQILTPVR